MNFGTIIKVIGPVVDIEFAHDDLPKIEDALKLVKGELVFEVQQQLSDNVVRTIAMGNTNGLRSGDQVQNTPTLLQVPIHLFDRMMTILGKPTSDVELIDIEKFKSLHHKSPVHAAPAEANEIMEQGIKLIPL